MEATETETPIHSLPPEILVKIFKKDGISFLDKKRGRLVCKYWKNVIDNNHSNIGVRFRVYLTNETVNAVKNLTWPKIDCLMIYRLTREFDIFSSFPQGIETLYIGSTNSAFNFWSALSCCDDKKVEYLELSNEPPMDLDADNQLNFSRPNFKSVKKLKMRVYNVVIHDQESKIVKTGWDSVMKILRLPSLETFIFVLSGTTTGYPLGLSYFYDLLNHNIWIKSLVLKIRPLSEKPLAKARPDSILPMPMPDLDLTDLQLEKLDLRFDFRFAHHVLPLMGVKNHKLKQLRLKRRNEFRTNPFTTDGDQAVEKLVHLNSASLELLSYRTCYIDFPKLQLENCHSLKVLKLKCRTVRFIHERFRILNIKALTLNCQERMDTIFGSILAVVEQGLEEFKMEYYQGFDILQFQRVLGLPRIKKIVLTGITEPHPPLIITFCNNAPDIKTAWVNKSGRTDYHITIE